MEFINSLWRGAYTPQKQRGGNDPSVQEMAERLDEMRLKILEALPDDARAQFDDYEALSAELESQSEEHIYADAFRMGARLMLEILSRA